MTDNKLSHLIKVQLHQTSYCVAISLFQPNRSETKFGSNQDLNFKSYN